MTIATLTAKGQLTVPKSVRAALGLQAGSQVRFELDADGSSCRVERLTRPVARLAGALPYKGPVKTIEQMDDGMLRLPEKSD